MKARQYDSRFLERRIQPNIFAIRESNYLSRDTFDYIAGNSAELRTDLQALVDTFYDAKEYGSLLQMPNVDFKGLFDRFDQIVDDIHFHKDEAIRSYLPVIHIAEILSRKYAAVVTNPPYLNKFDAKLKQFIVANYKNYGGDLFSAFIYRNLLLCKADGFAGYMTPNVWMFIKTYEKLRQYLLAEKTISSLIQLAKGAFFKEATVDICSFVLKNKKELVPGLYIRLEEFKGGMDVQRQKVLEAIANPNCGYFYEATASNFSKIPGTPIAYWVSEQFLKAFKAGTLLNNIGEIVTGISTGKNDLYLRTWSEVNLNSISIYASDIDAIDFNVKKWLPYNKGGEARKWYGNNDYVVKWSEAEHFHRSRPTFKHLYLKEGLTWSFVTSGMFSARYYPKGFLWDVAGSPCVIKNHDLLLYSLAFLSTKIANAILKIINPTINCQVDDIQRTPIIVDHDKMCIIYQIANDCVNISKYDWDSYEASWDFKKHPLI